MLDQPHKFLLYPLKNISERKLNYEPPYFVFFLFGPLQKNYWTAQKKKKIILQKIIFLTSLKKTVGLSKKNKLFGPSCSQKLVDALHFLLVLFFYAAKHMLLKINTKTNRSPH